MMIDRCNLVCALRCDAVVTLERGPGPSVGSGSVGLTGNSKLNECFSSALDTSCRSPIVLFEYPA